MAVDLEIRDNQFKELTKVLATTVTAIVSAFNQLARIVAGKEETTIQSPEPSPADYVELSQSTATLSRTAPPNPASKRGSKRLEQKRVIIADD